MRILSLIFLYFFAVHADAQVTLILTDPDGVRVEDATVICESGYNGVSSSDGIVNMPEITGSCVIRHVSYSSLKFQAERLTSDTVIISLQRKDEILPEVRIQGYQEPITLKEAAGAYSYLSASDLTSFSDVTPVTAFNSLPGVRVEQRSPSSYRINIRGSTLRSPFGVRNVKVYWNQIPLTEPTGNTPLNMTDLAELGNTEIIRGPSGSIYGAGTGGVLLFQNALPNSPGFSAEGAFSAGSFGMRRFQAGITQKSDVNSLRISVSAQEADGYRDHSAFQRKNVMLTGQAKISDKQRLSYHILYGSLDYQLPGGLTEEQYLESPTMARQIAISRNSSIDQDYLFGGVQHDISWGSWHNQTTVFFSASNKKNPFITNFEYEDLAGSGFRTRFTNRLGGEASHFLLTAGGEWQWGKSDADNFGNRDGNPDTVRYIDRNSQFTGFEFAKLTYSNGPFRITAAGSLNHLRYKFDRRRDAELDSAYRLERSFRNVFTPRIGIVYSTNAFTVHASYSEGFSPPVLDEVRTSDAQINTMLEAEEARNFEAGIRGRFFNDAFAVDLNLFYMRLDNTIVSQIDENGTSTFFNSGATNQRGLEMLAGLKITENTDGFVRYAYLRSSLTWYHFRFSDYERAAGDMNVDYSGNELTGAPEYIITSTLNLHFGGSVRSVINYQRVSEIPLNDANTVYSNAYDLMQLRIAWRVQDRINRMIELYAGVDNLLDQSYSLGNDLNAFGNRYFNPAATRNYFAGIRVRFGSQD
ncbi:MAG: TonB-dependent receptor plug domain-containing protein [Cyclobacteriaceae bacterium]